MTDSELLELTRTENFQLRRLLFAAHNDGTAYGDDGEMQLWCCDFLRAPIGAIEMAICNHNFGALSAKRARAGWTGSAARRLRLLHDVRSGLPFAPFSVAKARVYDPAEIDVNPHGAVSVMTPGGWLGIKPNEMEWLDDIKPLTGQSR